MNPPETVRPAASAEQAPTSESSAQRSEAKRWQHIRALELLGKRRHFLVDKRSQLRATLLTSVVVLVLLVLLNASLHAARERSAAVVATDAPELGALLASQNRLELSLVAMASVVFLAGVIVVTILETHKTAGAAYNLARHMAAIQAGHYSIRLKLRRGDNLGELEAAFNDMSRALQERADEDIRALEGLADSCERLAGPEEAAMLAQQLRDRARLTGRFLD